jgi:hypothetical protein
MRYFIATLAAAAVQPLIFLLRIAPEYFASPEPLYGLGGFLMAIVVVASGVALLLGIPAFLLLNRFGRASWTSLAIAGATLGMLPVALAWPRHLPGYSAGVSWHGKYVDTYIQGGPTTYAWLTYGENVFYFGVHGLIGALVFYAIWRRLDRSRQLRK